MPAIEEYLEAIKVTFPKEHRELALRQLSIARDFLTSEQKHSLEHAPSTEAQINLLNEWFFDFLSPKIKQMLALIAENHDWQVLADLEKLKEKQEIEVVTKKTLQDESKQMVTNEIGRIFPGHTIAFQEDPQIIGGVKIRIGELELDYSIQKKLQAMLKTDT